MKETPVKGREAGRRGEEGISLPPSSLLPPPGILTMISGYISSFKGNNQGNDADIFAFFFEKQNKNINKNNNKNNKRVRRGC